MTSIKRLSPLLPLSLGAIGVVICIAGIVAVCLIGLRLIRTTGNVFARIDASFASVRDRVDGARQHIRAAKITSEDIQQNLKNWTRSEAKERLTSRLGVEEKAERMSSGLQQTDHWLELAESSVQLVQEALTLVNSTGVPTESGLANRLLEDLAWLRVQLTQASEMVERIRVRTAGASDEKSVEGAIDEAAPLTLRVIATLSSIDSRIEDFGNSLSETRTKTEILQTKLLRWMRTATICIVLLILWMAAGQLSLFLRGCALGNRTRRREHD